MSEFQNLTEEINNMIDKVADLAEMGTDMLFSPIEEGAVQEAEKSMRKCKKVCKRIGVIVLVVCMLIIFFHLRG